MPKAQAIQSLIEAKHPGVFTFDLSRDAGTSGRLEVSVNGTVCHSKANGDGYVTDDNKAAMLEKVSAAMK